MAQSRLRPPISLEVGRQQVIAAMDRDGRVHDADVVQWKDRLITAQRRVCAA